MNTSIRLEIPCPSVGDTVTHCGKERRVAAVSDFGYMWRVWVKYDSETESPAREGYFEILKPKRQEVEDSPQFKAETQRLKAKSILSQLFDEHFDPSVTDEDTKEECADAAIALIMMGGFDAVDSDDFGSAMEEDLETILMIAMRRCKQLRDRINGTDGEYYITLDES